MMYPPKWISKPTATIEIGAGNHRVSGVAGPLAEMGLAETEEIICLQCPAPRPRRSSGQDGRPWQSRPCARARGEWWWQANWWRRLAETTGLEHALECEWAASSYADDCLDVYGVRHPLVYDTRLRHLFAPWVQDQALRRTARRPARCHSGRGRAPISKMVMER